MDFAQHLRIALFDGGNGIRPFDADALQRLDEASAFVGRPAVRFIVSTAVRSGIFERWAEMPGWCDAARMELERFVAHTGFEVLLVEGIFSAYAEVLGWGALQPCDDDWHSVCEPRAGYGNRVGMQVDMATEVTGTDVLAAYNAAINVDREKEAARGVTLEAPCAVEAGARYVRITAVLRRLRPMGSASLRCTVMAEGGIVSRTFVVEVLTVASPSVLPVAFDVPRTASLPSAITLCVS